MKRILFVDDEPKILDGLRNMFRRYRHEWEMTFVESGEEALGLMTETTFDVIVSDMRMPRMDGAELLRRVQELRPRTVRIVLSGQTDHQTAIRAAQVAHRFLAKPCDGPTLHEAIERACRLTFFLLDEGLRTMVGKLGQLPALPRVASELTEALAAPDSSLKDAAAIVERDPALCAKVFQLVNSAFFGLPRRIVAIEQAVSYLGADVLRGIALMMSVLDKADAAGASSSARGFSYEAVQAHSVLTARLAQRIGADTIGGNEAFLAGMLHEVGTLILGMRRPDELGTALEEARRSGRPLPVCEREILGVAHGEIGAYLLGLWGLPLSIVEAVAFHHEPSRANAAHFDLLGIVHVADCLAAELDPSPPSPDGAVEHPLDHAYLNALSLAGEVPRWRREAEEFVETLEVS